jgi:predicted DNA-binding transcriptional regulator AlpA
MNTTINEETKSRKKMDYLFELGYRMASGCQIRHEDHEAFHAMINSIVKPAKDEVPDDPLAQLPADQLLTVDEVLSYLPVKISHRAWLEGARTGRYPAAIHINQRTLRWRARDIQQYVTMLKGALDAGEDRR